MSRCGIPQANSTTSSPRVTSPTASESTLPCSAVMAAATSSLRAARISRNAKSTWVRRVSDEDRHSAKAPLAAATAASTSSGPARSTCAVTAPVAGSKTSPRRPAAPSQSLPPTQCVIRAVSLIRAVCPARPLARGRDQLGDLDGVERRALAQVVAADEQRQPAAVRHTGSVRIRPTKVGSGPAACSGVGTSVSTTPGAAASSSVAAATDSGRANSALSDSECPVKTGTRTQVPETRRSGMPRILRLSLRSFCSSSVSKEPSSTTDPAIGRTLKAIGATYFAGVGNVTDRAVVGQRGGLLDDLAHLLVQLLDAGQAAAGDRLVGARDQPDQAGLVVQRLEHRHRRHRRAVGVGDDALACVRRSRPG